MSSLKAKGLLAGLLLTWGMQLAAAPPITKTPASVKRQEAFDDAFLSAGDPAVALQVCMAVDASDGIRLKDMPQPLSEQISRIVSVEHTVDSVGATRRSNHCFFLAFKRPMPGGQAVAIARKIRALKGVTDSSPSGPLVINSI